MVNINDVYTTVQAILNKEQRGYLAPLEFNKYAAQAQLEIVESYFSDKAHFLASRKGAADMNTITNINKKIDILMRTASLTYDSTSTNFDLPSDYYRIFDVRYTGGTTPTIIDGISHEGSKYILSSRLTSPTTTYPKYLRFGDEIKVHPTTITTSVEVDYVKKPANPIWGYTSLGSNRTPIYDSASNKTTHFEVHESEQYVLVHKILMYAGVQVKQADIVQFALQEDQLDNQNKKS